MGERLRAVEDLLRPIEDALAEHDITPSWWVGEMKEKALGASIVKFLKVWSEDAKGIVDVEKFYADNRIRFESLRELGRVAQFYPGGSSDSDLPPVKEYSDEERVILKKIAIEFAKSRVGGQKKE